MNDMFGLSMMGNYEQRKVANYKEGDLVVDTAAVTDSKDPYETGIKHPFYNNGNWVIVETYETKEQAQKGHDKWVKTMTADKPPEKLVDCSTFFTAELLRKVGVDMSYEKNETKGIKVDWKVK